MKLNKKGYMLVEIILASAIAFGVGYFILQMVINLKNKNDDLLVETLMSTDQTIIMNKLMEYAKIEGDEFSCEKLSKTGNALKYDGEIIDIVNDYAMIGDISCTYEDSSLLVSVPLRVEQFKDKNYDVKLNYNPSNPNSTGVPNPEVTQEMIDNSDLYKVEFACDDGTGYAYWNGISGWNKYEVSYDALFKAPNHLCRLRQTGAYNVVWELIGDGGKITRYYKDDEIKYSDLVDNGLLSQSDKNNKRVIFYAEWH